MKDLTEMLQTQGREHLHQTVIQNTRTLPATSNGRHPMETNIAKPNLPQIVTLESLIGMDIKLPDVLIDGVLHRGSTMVFGGGSKTNKTFCLMDMALSVAAGVPWWGMKTTKGRVLYLDFELQKPFFAHRAKAICDAKGLPISTLGSIDVWNLRGFAADLSSQIDEILERIKARDYALIIIDPIYKALGKRDENCAGDINSLMNEIDKLAVNTGASVVIGHHFSKGNQAGKESMDRISGSGVFGRSPDAIMILTAHEQEQAYTVESTLRHFKRLEPFCLEWCYPLMERNEKLNPAKLKKAGAAQLKYTPEQLLNVLGREQLTTEEWQRKVCAATGMKERTFSAKKKELLEERRIEKTEDGRWKQVGTIVYPVSLTSVSQERLNGEGKSVGMEFSGNSPSKDGVMKGGDEK